MNIVQLAKDRADRLHQEFVLLCLEHYPNDKWGYYHAHENSDAIPDGLDVAHAAYTKALHEYFALRDGPNGFLGGRGA